jgi:RNA polymerase sigma-70 factor (ECF subfamily)
VSETPPTTAELIREWKQGCSQERQEQIFHLLFERYSGRVYLFFQRKRLPAEDCYDLTQETLFSVFKGLKELRHEVTFESWLFTIARNVFSSRIEQSEAQKRKVHLLSLDHHESGREDEPPIAARLADSLPDPETSVLDNEKLEKLYEALAQLPEQMRRCAHLRFAEDLSYQEIAALLEISIGTVKAHLNQARRRLREQLSGYFTESDFDNG